MAKENIRQFRKDIAALKRKGLITGVDARSVQPTPHLRKLVSRFDDVLSGKATPVKLSKTETKNLKAAGYDVYKGRTIFPHSAGEKVGVSHGHAKIRQPHGVSSVTIPVQYHNLDSYLKAIRKNEKTIDAMKKRDEYFAFRFYGHQSLAIYRNIDLLIDDLMHYEAVENARHSKSAKSMNEIYRNLEIVTVHRQRDWTESGQRQRDRRSTYDPEAYQRAKAKRERGPGWKKQEFDDYQAEKQRRARARLKKHPKDYEAYKAAARKRAAKSWKKQKREMKDARRNAKKKDRNT